MEKWPRISIVTPSFNQGRYIGETIDSVRAQDYPNLEHIVVEGSSVDETLEVLKRYPHLHVVSVPNRGHAGNVNLGFTLATGEIWGFLNSDDTLTPGALHRVAQEIAPERGRHIVMGRCRFTDAQSRYIGIEHPSQFSTHDRVLRIWKGHTIPQPATFWTPQVWRECGPLDESLRVGWIDYDLFCRFSRQYTFWPVDQVWATYCLHETSQTSVSSEAKRLEESIVLSRRYWGAPWMPRYWRLALSLAWHQFDRARRARRWLRHAQEGWRQHQVLAPLPWAIAGGLLAPEVVFYVTLYPFLRARTQGRIQRLLERLAEGSDHHARTTAYLERTAPWEDGWIGPRFVTTCETTATTRTLRLHGEGHLQYFTTPLVLTIRVDGQEVGEQRIEHEGPFTCELPLPKPEVVRVVTVEIDASAWFVPHRFLRNRDFRPLAWRLIDLSVA